MNTLDLHSAVYVGSHDRVFDELERLAALVGIDIVLAAPGSQEVAGVLNFTSAHCPEGYVSATFHELFATYFAKGRVELSLRDDTADILELMVAVGATVRGRVIGVVGASGGLGVSTLAALLARIRADDDAALMDFNPASAGIDMMLAIQDTPGHRWADIPASGALLAGRLADSLPTWHGVRVLSADARGGVPLDSDLGIRAVSALSQVCAWTVVDLAPSASLAADHFSSVLEWCDHVLLVVGSDDVAVAQGKVAFERLGSRTTVVAAGVRPGGKAAHISTMLGTDVLPWRPMRGMRADVDHGVAPGDHLSAGVRKNLKAIFAEIETETA